MVVMVVVAGSLRSCFVHLSSCPRVKASEIYLEIVYLDGK